MGILYSEPICKAAYRGELHQVYQLLKADSKNLNVQDELFGDTPLIAACKGGNVNMVKYLLDKKADVSIRNKKERTCLHYAAKRTFSFLDYLMIVILMPILLIGYLIMKKIQNEHVKLLDMVLNTKADINAVDYKGNTPLHYACQCKSHLHVSLLLKANADTSIKNKDGETPLDIAVRLKFQTIIVMLEKSK
ncbi:ankyrin repeat domain-containing protein 22 isoform X1 [Clarias gariepinus]|uniref:ankyrin repeat domain-containing protein 22 isoform X1 n=1 Tax=Clarias gariepinus TaxID=13013 RepID=UPI00234DB738|nr:ankyrin repeat domain-containing protein 22 isoform X1 [Clarias gariepinus]